MPETYKRAVQQRHAPKERVLVYSITSMTAAARAHFLTRVLRPNDCSLTTEQLIHSLPNDGAVVIKIITRMHKLIGKPSNAAKGDARTAFINFVRLRRSPTGTTVDASGRMHGAAFYLCAKWDTLRPLYNAASPDTLPSFFFDFIAALEGSGIKPPSSRSIARWFDADFGSTSQRGGVSVASQEHTSVFPHATDACATCVVLNADVARSEQSLKRHKQQEDQRSMHLISARNDVELAGNDAKEELKRHRAEATDAIDACKTWLAQPRCSTTACARNSARSWPLRRRPLPMTSS